MGFLDLLSSFSDKFSFGSKLNKNFISKKSTLEVEQPKIPNYIRDIHIDTALSGLNTVRPRIIKVKNYRTMTPEHGKLFIRNGVRAKPLDGFELNYNGLLAQKGAEKVFAVVGYGANDCWEERIDIPMRKIRHNTFTAYIPIKTKSVNIAFKDELFDNHSNWDNNSGNNYCYDGDLLKNGTSTAIS